MIQIDIEMPKSCADCPMCHPKGKDEPWNFCCFGSMQDVDVSVFDSKRLESCPLQDIKECEERASGQCPYHSD